MRSTENLPNGLKDSIFDLVAATGFCWVPDPGIGRLPPEGDPAEIYDQAYWESYCARADTPIGRALTAARVALVSKYMQVGVTVVDVGIGAGQFVDRYPYALGFDINPHAVEWLNRRNRWGDLYGSKFDALCFWDSLEHIPVPADAVRQAKRYVFVSLPIFADLTHCLNSKHYKPGEHLWYFTDRGIRVWFDAQGFDCVEQNHMEIAIGREGIGTYVFKRR